MKTKLIKKYGRRLIVSDTGRIWRDAYFDKQGHFREAKELLCNRSKHNKYNRIQIMQGNKNRTLLVHRLVAECFLPDYCEDLDVDHIKGVEFGDGVDNLRMLTRSKNCRAYCKNRPESSSKYRGVTWCKRTKRWLAQCWDGIRNHNLGRYDKETEAAKVYNRFAKNHGFLPEALNQV